MADIFSGPGSTYDGGVVEQGSAPQEPAPQFADDPETGDLLWGDAPEADDAPEPEAGNDAPASDDPFDAILAAADDPAPQQPQQPAPQARPDTMPEHFDERLLDPRNVEVLEANLRTTFQQFMGQAQTKEHQDAVNLAYQASLGALKMKAEYARSVALAYDLFQKNQQMSQQLAPARLVAQAKKLADQWGVDDYKSLLKNPRTGKPITDPATMEAVASVLGNRDRERRVAKRAGVDRPLNPTQGSGGRRSIANLDPHSKEFEAIERAVESGRHVRLLG